MTTKHLTVRRRTPVPMRRERPRQRDHARESPPADEAMQYDTTGRRPRALSSPVRSVASDRHEMRARSPSAGPARTVLPPPGPPLVTPGDAPPGVGSDEITRAYFSIHPPSAPLSLVLITVPPPAPVFAPVSASFTSTQPTTCLSSNIFLSPVTCEKESLTEGKENQCREVSIEASLLETEFDTLHLSRITPSDERGYSSLVSQDKSREWASRLRDGHVRLALRALRQLRRAERLHRALTRSTCPRGQLHALLPN